MAGFFLRVASSIVVGPHDGVELFSVDTHDAQKNFGVVGRETYSVSDPGALFFGIAGHVAEVMEDDGIGSGMSSGCTRPSITRGLCGRFCFLRLRDHSRGKENRKCNWKEQSALHEGIIAPWYEVKAADGKLHWI